MLWGHKVRNSCVKPHMILPHVAPCKSRLTLQSITSWVRLGNKDTHKYFITFRSSTVPALIRLSSFQCVITNSYSPIPMRCKKGQKLGHTKNECRSKTEHCRTCSQPGHASCDLLTPPPVMSLPSGHKLQYLLTSSLHLNHSHL